MRRIHVLKVPALVQGAGAELLVLVEWPLVRVPRVVGCLIARPVLAAVLLQRSITHVSTGMALGRSRLRRRWADGAGSIRSWSL